MKKVAALLLAVIMVLSLAACSSGDSGNTSGDVDMSAYPSDLQEWTAENFNSYFQAVGLYTDESLIYVQDHATYYTGTVVDTCGGYMSDDASYFTGVFIVNENSTEGDGQEFLDYVKENQTMPEDFGSLPVDHMVGHVIFMYGLSTDDEFYEKMEAAVLNLISVMGAEKDF